MDNISLTRKITAFLLVIAFCVLSCVSLNSCTGTQVFDVDIAILKIGKADCIIIDTGANVLMIDTGEVENLADIHSYMREKGYEKLDMLILTHFDKDHIGGATEIISEYGVTTIIESKGSSKSDEYISYHNKLTELGITPMKLSENYSFSLDGCSFEISIPKKDKYSEKNANNSSLIISMKFGEQALLFCGDAMELRIDELLEDSPGHYDFVKLPYHGNYLENYREFLNELTPRYGVITCSSKNPADERVLALLDEYKVHSFQTKNGRVEISSDGTSFNIHQ